MQSVCIYCGSNRGSLAGYAEASRGVGRELARRGITLVYGGGNVGLMGEVADAATAAGGKVIGVIPQALVDKELAHAGLAELRVVGSMHERKALMADLSDAFIALPGGLGTLEELFEIATWTQLGFQHKPCGLLNVAGFYDQLLAFLDHATQQGFIRAEYRKIILADDRPERLLDAMSGMEVPYFHKWIDRSER
ncbi:MAG TPA: TIGR00730 family Rossman fold protein [Verrucomicrobiae bacterium]|nr:TIGR00730 family Rossman fold protein [Verrucomicrobiae bacterium]